MRGARAHSTPHTEAMRVFLLAWAVAGCGTDEAVAPSAEPRNAIETRIDQLLPEMSLEEKIGQMNGLQALPIEGLYHAGDNERLGIPGFRMVDGPRGVRAGEATTFPVAMARGAAFDVELERRIGAAIGEETAARGGNVILAPCINILRHPGWGRAQETYGEDVHHLGEMGVAFVDGAQTRVLASVKHFAANSIEDTRFTVNVSVDERTLREIYLPHFEETVRRARVASVMSAYNKVNGHYSAENAHLLRDVLKGDWEFDGFVESDWILGTRSTVESALGGLDIEMPMAAFYGPKLFEAVKTGGVPEAVIDEAVRRILRKKFEFGLDAPRVPAPDAVESAEHVALALEAARKSMVLLRNEANALPLDRTEITKLAVVGELAGRANLGDAGSSNAMPSYAVTPLDGLKSRAGSLAVTYAAGPDFTPAEAADISGADAAVVVVGLTAEDEGENLINFGGDRDSLDLRALHADLIERVSALNSRTIVVVEGGSAVTMPWIDAAAAVLMAWYPGMEGGNALADILFGDVAPSGKLPITFPRSVDQLPVFVHDQDEVSYGYFHGYRFVDREGTDPLFPFGFGLGYTTFEYAGLRLEAERIAGDGVLRASVDVTNSGSSAGEEVVQLYVGYDGSRVERAVRELKAFARVELDPGETKTVELEVPARKLAYWDVDAEAWVVEALRYQVSVGGSSRDLPVSTTFEVAGR